ncbi:MAG: helix-turn-helix domain-containing protein [Chloroflexi bacterium OHK40]
MSRTRTPAAPTDPSYGLASWCGMATSMGHAHRHNDLELNLVERGGLSYRFGDQLVELREGDLGLFWAARPHQLSFGHPDLWMHWVTLPLATFLSWRLPEHLAGPVLRGMPLIWPWPDRGIVGQLARWHAALARGGAERQRIVSLELEALLRRCALELVEGEGPPARAPQRRSGIAERMAHFIAEHYARPLTVAEVATAVGLHPHYAMQRFRQSYGVSMLTYLTQYRVARAQELLATTKWGVLEIGLAAGFGSASRFHSAFKAACGVSPGAYRAGLRAAAEAP